MGLWLAWNGHGLWVCHEVRPRAEPVGGLVVATPTDGWKLWVSLLSLRVPRRPLLELHVCVQGAGDCWLLALLRPGYSPTVDVALAAAAAVLVGGGGGCPATTSVVVAAVRALPPPVVAAGTVRLWLMGRQREDCPSSVWCNAVHAVSPCSALLLPRRC